MRHLTCLATLLLATSALAQTTTISTSPIAQPVAAPMAAPITPPAQAVIAQPVAQPLAPSATMPPIQPGAAPMMQMGAAPQGQPPAGGAGIPGMSKAFDEADTNHDGVVTKQEFISKAENHFNTADSDHDGKITRQEMAVQEQKMMQQMQQKLMGNGNLGQKLQNGLNAFMGGQQPGTQPAPVAAGTMAMPSAGAGLSGTAQQPQQVP